MTVLTCASTGKSITLLGEEIANSGEAKVWRTNQNGYLAKIYHCPTHERVQKLAVMIANPPTEPNSHLNHVSFAWPKSALKNAQGDCVGFLMPEIKDGKELIDVYNPRRRKALKLEVDWRFLHTTALNIVSIIEALHAAGYVLGDIKPQNILVNNRALPSIIDTDSFQLKNPKNSKVYNCLVGSEGYTPPELIGKDFDSIEQTEVHDRFRLALIIYQLLFSGNSPFDGKWTGAGETPELDERIKRGIWLYSPDNLIQPVDRTIPMKIVHPEIQKCFIKCFNDGYKNPHLRPTAKEWLEALRIGNENLTICGRVDSHFYSRTYGSCYWCDRSAKLGVDIFPGVVKVNSSNVVASKSQSQVFVATNTLELVQQQGKIITVVGKVVITSHLSSTNILFINFGNVSSLVNGYSPFTIVIFSEGLKNLYNSRTLTVTQLRNWVGSYIKITGTLELYKKSARTTPQIILKDSNQISLISQSEAYKLIAGQTDTNTSYSVQQNQSQVSQPAVSQPQNQTIITQKSGTYTNTNTVPTVPTVQPTQSKVPQTNQSANLPRQVAQTPVYKPQSQSVTTPFVSNKKLKKVLLTSAIVGLVVTQIYGYARSVLFPTNSISVIAKSPRSISLEKTLSGHSQSVISVAYSPNGQTLASGSADDTIKLWDVTTGNLLQTLSGHSYRVAFSPDGQTLASINREITDETIKLWDVRTGNLLQTLSGHSYGVSSVAFSPDGQTLASGSRDKTIKLWDVRTGNILQTLSGHSYWVNSVAFSPDGQTLASSGSTDNTIKLWNVRTGNLLQTLTARSSMVAFSPDGQTLASGNEYNIIKLWNVTTGKLLQTITGHSDGVFSVAFSPDGQTLASGSRDKTIKLWDVRTGKLLQTITGHSDWVFSLAFSPDGQTLASGGRDKTIKIWRLR
ncbi:protein kinase domain-containing protein [Anabaena azotica]|uniref:protein kinase domain-containing protein n=1 Tax=Anabaena azotica TaxID=197653 RepID=UPI0039A553BD